MNEIKLINDIIGIIANEPSGSIKRIRIYKKIIKILKKRKINFAKCNSDDKAWMTAIEELEQGKDVPEND